MANFDSGYVWTTAMYLGVNTRLRFYGSTTRTSLTNVRVNGTLEVYQGNAWNINAIYGGIRNHTSTTRVKPRQNSGGTWTASVSYDVTVSGSGAGSFSNIADFVVYNDAETQPIGSWSPAVTATVYYDASGTPPSGLAISLGSRTWNSVGVQVSVTSMGDGTYYYHEAKVLTSNSNGYLNADGICIGRYKQESSNSLTHTLVLNNSNSTVQPQGPIDIKGCQEFKIGGAVYTSTGYPRYLDNTIYYLPPAPLQSISVSSQVGSDVADEVTETIAILGGDSSVNIDTTVTTEYRYSADGGANYTAWASAGTGRPWETQYFTFTCVYNAAIKIQARQVYQGQYSEEKEISYNAINTTPPDTPTVTNFVASAHGATATVSTTSYGHPNALNGRYVELNIGPVNGGTPYRLQGITNVMSADFLVDNNSGVYPSGTLDIQPNTYYAYRGLASNLRDWVFSQWVNFVTTPEAPTASTLTVTGQTTADLTITSPWQGNADTMTAYYQLNSGAWVSAGTITSEQTITVNLTNLIPGTSYTATVKISNSGGDSGTYTSNAITTYKAPSTPVITNFTPLVNGAKATVSISSYGVPASVSGRYIELEVGPAGGGEPYHYMTVGNTTSQHNMTVTNSSAVWPAHGSLQINPNTKYAYRGYANNTMFVTVGSWYDFITLPAAPTVTATGTGSTTGSITITAPSQGSASVLTAYYKIDSGNWVSAGTVTQGNSVTASVSGLASQTTYTVTVKLTNSSGDSATATTTFTTNKAMYGSVGGRTKTISKMYGSVGGETKRIVKFYGSVNGVTKQLF